MNLVPLHYAAHEGHGGPSYVVSFFSGCMFVIVAFWISRFVYELYRLDGAVGRAYLALPSFHVRRIWLQGGLSGALLTLGKFATIIAVTHLGNSVGNCFAQASMLVSGLWWVFPFFFSRAVSGIDYFMASRAAMPSYSHPRALHIFPFARRTGAYLDSRKSMGGKGF